MNSLTTDVDVVYIKGITFEAVVGPDAWHRPNKAQPVIVNVRLSPAAGLHAAAQEDDVNHTINYGTLYKSLMLSISNQIFESVQNLYQTIRAQLPALKSWAITVKLPKAVLLAEEGVTFEWTSITGEDGVQLIVQSMKISKIVSRCVIGVNSHERVEKQQLKISVLIKGVENRITPAMLAGVKVDAISVPVYQSLTKDVFERVEGSDYLTLEALASAIAQIATMVHGFENATVDIDKPSAIAGVEAAGVSIGRNRSFFENKDFWKVKRP